MVRKLGQSQVGIALDPPSELSHFAVAYMADFITDLRVDIRNQASLKEAIVAAKPDFVFHLATQALVRRSYDDPLPQPLAIPQARLLREVR